MGARPGSRGPAPALRPRSSPGWRAVLAAAACVACLPASAQFVDPLDRPAEQSPLAERRVVNAIARAGGRLVAVGERGHVLASEDGGATWRQAPAPVSVDLTAVHFASPQRGWAAGHGGVILATRDGGRSWTRQLDVRTLAPLLLSWYARHPQERTPAVERQLDALTGPGADASFLDVWFADERTGFAVGAFNLVMGTEDGGETWTPWLHRAENPESLHLYAIRPVGDRLYVAGERGLVLALDRTSSRLEASRLPRAGTFFGIARAAGGVVVYGLRGRAFRSGDAGATWDELRTGLDEALVAGAELPDGRVVLVTQGGRAVVSADGSSFRPLALARGGPVSCAVARGDGALVLGGAAGLRVEPVAHREGGVAGGR